MAKINRWIIMVALCLSGGTIFMLPFLREIYYIPMQNAFGFTNTEMGMLMSVFGFMSMLTYFPGGWLADRFSPRNLITFSLLSTGLVGFYFSTKPSFEISLLIHGYWGASISLVFWSAMIKATRNWASHEEQGRAFGILEGGRGTTEAISGSTFGAIFIWLGSNDPAFSTVIILFSSLNVVLALLVWIALKNNTDKTKQSNEPETTKVSLHDIITVLKIPEVWLIAIVIVAAYSAYWGTFYFSPYSTSVLGMSVAMGVTIGMIKGWLVPISAIAAGFLGDKVGISRSVFFLLCFLTITYLAYVMFPENPNLLPLVLVNITITSIAAYALRGIYFALLEEGNIPEKLTGTAAGIVSVIGFMPDIYMPYVGGVLLDAFPAAQGYKYLFLLISVTCLAGALAAMIIMRRLNKRQTNNDTVEVLSG